MKQLILIIAILNLLNLGCCRDRIIFIRNNRYTVDYTIKTTKFEISKSSLDSFFRPVINNKYSERYTIDEDIHFIKTDVDYDMELSFNKHSVICHIKRSIISLKARIDCDKNENIRNTSENGFNGIEINKNREETERYDIIRGPMNKIQNRIIRKKK